MAPPSMILARGLPPETVEHIIDYLHDDRRSLLNCALTARMWLYRSRLHLYHTVRIATDPNAAALLRLAASASAPLLHLVRHLAIVEDVMPDEPFWRALAGKMPALESIAYENDFDPVFNPFPRFAGITLFPSIRALTLHGCSTAPFADVSAVILRLPRLAALELQSCNLGASAEYGDGALGPPLPGCSLRLASLVLRDIHTNNAMSFFLWVLRTPSRHSIRRLEFWRPVSYYQHMGYAPLRMLAQSLGPVLEDLALDLYAAGHVASDDDLQLQHNPSLRLLRLSSSWQDERLPRLLSRVTSTRLRRVHLTVVRQTQREILSSEKCRSCMSQIDQSLHDDVVRNLDEFIVTFRPEIKQSYCIPEVVLPALLPRLHRLGVLRVGDV